MQPRRHHPRTLRLKHCRRTAAALVEIALTLPIVLLMVAAFLELSRVSMLKQAADSAAYEGARAGIVAGAAHDTATSAAEKLLKASGIKTWRVQVQPQTIDENTPIIVVQVDIPVAGNTWIPPFFFKHTSSTGVVRLITERPAVVQLSGLEGSSGLGLGVSALGLGL